MNNTSIHSTFDRYNQSKIWTVAQDRKQAVFAGHIYGHERAQKEANKMKRNLDNGMCWNTAYNLAPTD